ncbi:MAG: 16S rRNA (guanine(966)-N(2))-methyltransferase RsmD [Ruminococcaceae bacterium]|nr:16S rRNA (guanine(966)-N(2))-methyltransferase RsmD [Oscillospiraceae bacterium]
MRIITGTARGCRLETLAGVETRPTTEKVKEALFSAIQFDIEGRRALDLFAGSGQLGIEALSRGAASCIFVDRNVEAVKIIRNNLQRARLSAAAQVVGTDVLSYLVNPKERFDLVFIDPPYAADLLLPTLVKVAPLVNDGGVIVCETDDESTLPERVDRFALARTYRYGRVRLLLYRYQSIEEGGAL